VLYVSLARETTPNRQTQEGAGWGLAALGEGRKLMRLRSRTSILDVRATDLQHFAFFACG
jgi:hypothetical protein